MKISKFILVKLIFGICAVEKCNAKVTAVLSFDSTTASRSCGIKGNDDLKDLYLCEKHYQQAKKSAIENDLNFDE